MKQACLERNEQGKSAAAMKRIARFARSMLAEVLRDVEGGLRSGVQERLTCGVQTRLLNGETKKDGKSGRRY
jgi:hypothetical protein